MHEHPPHHRPQASGRTLAWSMAVILAFAAVEALSGWWAGSLALLGDAGHMVSDATGLGIALLAVWIARSPPSSRHSYGLVRAEVLAALLNGLFMLAVVGGIIFVAIGRLRHPQVVQGGTVAVVAFIGLLVNIVVFWLLSRGEQNLNVRAALLHVLGDLLGSVAALVAGVVIWLTGWTPIDPLLSILICLLILYSSLHLLRDVANVIMEAVPHHLDLPQVGKAMAAVEGVESIHDLHIWAVSSDLVALSAHVVIRDMTVWEAVLNRLLRLLKEQYGIGHVTLQPELAARVAPVVVMQR
ncbi:MAG: cation transporter [Gammaproteobacteria bacterium RBG_16_57_12]|nr:MAG: cation transporter [Gammaproteobacteria bacterium RBG_16_57_12]